MAHSTATTGSVSEQLAIAILMRNGWDVSIPVAVESYDLTAKDPDTGNVCYMQVKTAKVRKDRDNSLVFRGYKSNGKVYTKDEVDYIIGVYGTEIYLIPNDEQQEYSVLSATGARERWRCLSLDV